MTKPQHALALGSALAALCLPPLHAQEGEKAPAKNFTSAVADIGIVVKDLDKSAEFYTEVLGLKEVQGFSVPAEKATQFGLTNNQPAAVRVFVLDDTAGTPNTKLKVMAFPEAPGAQPDQKYIHSTLGISYLTFFVTDMDRAVERLTKAGVKPLGKTPAALGGGNFLTALHDPDGNFIELIGPSKK